MRTTLFVWGLVVEKNSEKICTKCGELKPITEFHKAGFFDDGTQRYRGVCKPCKHPADSRKYRKYYALNRERVIEYCHTPQCRANRSNVLYMQRCGVRGQLMGEELEALLNSYNNKCAYCDAELPDKGWHLDHIIPLHYGGEHTIQNVVPACATCNQNKRNNTGWGLEEWEVSGKSSPK